MAKNSKAITKSCPACSKQVAVACKNCPCGHIFFVARRSAAALIQNKVKEAEKTHKGPPTPPEPVAELSGRRRTERVKRDKPDFYNASEYDKQRKPKSARQRLQASASEDRDDAYDEDVSSSRRVGRGRRRRKKGLAGEVYDDKKIEDDEAMPPVSAAKQAQMSVQLLEINRKLIGVNPVL